MFDTKNSLSPARLAEDTSSGNQAAMHLALTGLHAAKGSGLWATVNALRAWRDMRHARQNPELSAEIARLLTSPLSGPRPYDPTPGMRLLSDFALGMPGNPRRGNLPSQGP